MTNDQRIEGIRGWLAVLVAIVGIVTPLAQIGSLWAFFDSTATLRAMFGPTWPIYRLCLPGMLAIRVALCLIVAHRLVYRKLPATPRLTIIGIWIIYGMLGVLSVILASTLGPYRFPVVVVVGRLVGPLLVCVIATLYLQRSRRVADTYGLPRPEGLVTQFRRKVGRSKLDGPLQPD